MPPSGCSWSPSGGPNVINEGGGAYCPVIALIWMPQYQVFPCHWAMPGLVQPAMSHCLYEYVGRACPLPGRWLVSEIFMGKTYHSRHFRSL
jgi:hypothetical protein